MRASIAIVLVSLLGNAAFAQSKWTQRSPSPAPYMTYGVATSGEVTVAVGERGLVLSSTKGADWVVRRPADVTEASLNTVVWDGSQFVAVGGNRTLTSPDGVTWSRHASALVGSANAMVWTGSQFLAVGGYGMVQTSPDGVRW